MKLEFHCHAQLFSESYIPETFSKYNVSSCQPLTVSSISDWGMLLDKIISREWDFST
jgi:hypothetical protein